MSTVQSRPAAATPSTTAATLAKGALRRLALQQLQPTPENYARAYAEEAGASGVAQKVAAPGAGPLLPASTSKQTAALKEQAEAWAALTERLAKNLERGGRLWTATRRRQSLQRVLGGSRSDAQKLLQRLGALMTAWEDDVAAGDDLGSPLCVESDVHPTPAGAATDLLDATAGSWQAVTDELHSTLRAGLTPAEPASQALIHQLQDCTRSMASNGVTTEQQRQLAELCQQARMVFGQRHRLLNQLTALSRDLCASMVELAEEGSWARGQCEVVQGCLQPEYDADNKISGQTPPELSVRAVKAASQVLQQARLQQERLRGDRLAARDALKQLIHGMLLEVNELGDQTGRFESATVAHAEAIGKADSLQDLAGVVKTMLADSKAVNAAVSRSQARLQADSDRAVELEERVHSLEGELQRLSTEVSTDALTQVANRRGLAQAFATETARCQRQPEATLALALIDIDNFKKLNDSLGHAAGDVALKRLASEVKARLRPVDHLARFGGEEFVVLLPDTAQEEAQQALNRLQRSLTEALFLHEGREVFVTFSAGVTLWQPGESMETALERADGALYEAKRSGKNRTCLA